MRLHRIYAAVITVLISALIFASCMQERKESVKTVPSETRISITLPDFNYDKFYIMTGTMGDNNEYARLRYFNGDSVDMVVWKRSPSEYKYGDVFIPEDCRFTLASIV